jgi:hypothetical protein
MEKHVGWGKNRGKGRPGGRSGWITQSRAAAVLLSVLFGSGCALDEPEWAPLMYLQAEIADGMAETYCNVRRLFSPANPASAFAAQADPKLIELARRDAQRACLKGLEADTEERARRLPGRNNI